MSPNRELWLFVYFVCVPFCDTDLGKVVVNVGIATCEFSRYCQAYIQEGCAMPVNTLPTAFQHLIHSMSLSAFGNLYIHVFCMRCSFILQFHFPMSGDAKVFN